MGGEGVGKGEVDTPTSHSAVFMYARRVLVGRQWGRRGEGRRREWERGLGPRWDMVEGKFPAILPFPSLEPMAGEPDE